LDYVVLARWWICIARLVEVFGMAFVWQMFDFAGIEIGFCVLSEML
jgi:hypothetical protein